MKLLGNFYHIDATDESDSLNRGERREERGENFRCHVQLHPDHPLYRVHFPGNPVTPGVLLLQMATEILEQKFGTTLQFYCAPSIKFKKAVTPDDAPSFVFSNISIQLGQLSVRLSIEADDQQFVKMSLQYHIQ